MTNGKLRKVEHEPSFHFYTNESSLLKKTRARTDQIDSIEEEHRVMTRLSSRRAKMLEFDVLTLVEEARGFSLLDRRVCTVDASILVVVCSRKEAEFSQAFEHQSNLFPLRVRDQCSSTMSLSLSDVIDVQSFSELVRSIF